MTCPQRKVFQNVRQITGFRHHFGFRMVSVSAANLQTPPHAGAQETFFRRTLGESQVTSCCNSQGLPKKLLKELIFTAMQRLFQSACSSLTLFSGCWKIWKGDLNGCWWMCFAAGARLKFLSLLLDGMTLVWSLVIRFTRLNRDCFGCSRYRLSHVKHMGCYVCVWNGHAAAVIT